MSRRFTVTPAQLRGLLEALTAFGFTAARVEVSPTGAVTLFSQEASPPLRDPLAEWEADRGSRPH